MMRIGEEDTTKRKKVTITSSKKQKKQNRKTKETNKRKQRTFMSGYFSVGASVESRIIQSQEPKSASEKMTTKKKLEEISPRFPRVRFLKHASVPTI